MACAGWWYLYSCHSACASARCRPAAASAASAARLNSWMPSGSLADTLGSRAARYLGGLCRGAKGTMHRCKADGQTTCNSCPGWYRLPHCKSAAIELQQLCCTRCWLHCCALVRLACNLGVVTRHAAPTCCIWGATVAAIDMVTYCRYDSQMFTET